MMVHIGHDAYINTDKISTIIPTGSSPTKKLRKGAEEKGLLIDATAGNKTRSVIIMTTGQIVLSALQPKAVTGRINRTQKRKEDSYV
jgi:regulator of extracellular matrix RemA (YlzA/DUF370 family)